MIRRRRRTREIAFSFDSFLDVVANVVGIIIRLILVVWVGARSYTGLLPPQLAKRNAANQEARQLTDPLEGELEQERRELAAAQARLLEQLRNLEMGRAAPDLPPQELATLAARQQNLEQERTTLDHDVATRGQSTQVVMLSAKELRERCQHLGDEVRALEKLPPLKKTYRYKTPVSQPVQSEEMLFECQSGRITFIDIGALLQQVRDDMQQKGEELRSVWQVSGSPGPVGAFRLRYFIEREKNSLESVATGGLPDKGASFRYALTGWVVEPMSPDRGEPLEQALKPGSEFRRIVDAIDPMQTVVTFWVYPDSFGTFRQVRDYLYERDVVVAGRPLPTGAPIASSRHGTRSRGQ
jgi:hypothetical protein